MNKPNYVAEAPYQPGYEDAVVTEPRPYLSGIYKSKPLTDEEIEKIYQEVVKQPNFMMLGDTQRFARAIEERHGIK